MNGTPGGHAHAVARAWGLFGRLLLDGPTREVGALARQLPALAPLLDGRTEDALAAEHYALLGRAVPPFASVFVAPDGQVGGDVTDAARRALEATGGQALRDDVEPDHVGCLLLGLSFLRSAEAEALDDGLASSARHLRARGDALLAEQLLPWLPALVVAARREGVSALAETLALSLELALSVGVTATAPTVAPDDLLDDPRTGLKAIVRYLLAPARSGLYLSHAAIARVGAAIDVPHGFGARYRMLEGLVLAAVDHGVVPGLVAALTVEVDGWRDDLLAWGSAGADVDGWLLRLERTREVLGRIGEAAARGEPT